MILHFDTETTGLPVPGAPSDDPRHPHIVSLSAILDDDQGVTRRVISVLVKPDGYVLEAFPEAQKIHGITTEAATRFGLPLIEVVRLFHAMAMGGTTLSAFNLHFDYKLIKIACTRLGDGEAGSAVRAYFADHVSSICTMESAAKALSGKTRISLKNAYFELFKEENKQAHRSLGDAFASRRIFYELKARGALPEPKSLAEKVYDTPYTPTEGAAA